MLNMNKIRDTDPFILFAFIMVCRGPIQLGA
jgi:hypothetical protein